MNYSKLSQIAELDHQKSASRVEDSKKNLFGGSSRNISLKNIGDAVRLVPSKDPVQQKSAKQPIVDTKKLPEAIQKIVDSLNTKIEDSTIKELLNSSRNTRRTVLENLSPSLRRRVLDSLKSVRQIIDEEDAEEMPDIELSMSAEDIADYLRNGTEDFISKIDLMPKPLQTLCVELVETDPKSEERSAVLHKIADLFKEKSISFISDSELSNFLESENMGDGEEAKDQSPMEIFGNALLDLSSSGDIETFAKTLDETGLLGEHQADNEDDLNVLSAEEIGEELTPEEAEGLTEEDLSDEQDVPTLDSLRLVRYAIKNNKITDSLKSFLAKRNIIVDTDMSTLACTEEQYHCPPMTLEEYHTSVLIPKIQFFARVMAACGRYGAYCEGKPVAIEYDGTFVYIHNQLGGTKVFVPVAPVPADIANLEKYYDNTSNLVSFDEIRNIAQTIGEEDICDFNVYKKNPFKSDWVK